MTSKPPAPAMTITPAQSQTSAARELLGYEDLLVFYGLHKAYKRMVHAHVPPNFEHLTAALPGPSLYSQTKDGLKVSTQKDTLLGPLAFNPMPLPLRSRPITAAQRTQLASLSYTASLNSLSSVKEKEERLALIDRERKKGDKRKRDSHAEFFMQDKRTRNAMSDA